MFGLGLRGRANRLRASLREGATALSRPRLWPRGIERLDVVFSEPHDMPMGDRISLYALIRGLKPARYLEIGVRWGGSARIVAAAMQANGSGRVVGLDPSLKVFRPSPRELFGRVDLVEGYSPEDIHKAVAALSGPPDFVFIDAVHTYSAVKLDLEGVYPVLADEAHILLHDAFHQGVNQATDEFLLAHPELTDLGVVSRNAAVGSTVSYGGLRLLRKGRHDFATELAAAHRRDGTDMPELSADLWDHDAYANRIGNPLGRKRE